MSTLVRSAKKVPVERAAFLGDIHVPYQDDVAVDLALDFLAWFKPDKLWLIGDIVDFYQLSRFSKDPSRVPKLQDDLDATTALLKRFRGACPKAHIVYLDGNHEDRLRRFCWDTQVLASVRKLTVPKLLGLDELQIEHHPYGRVQSWHGLMVEHGDRVSRHSAYTAKSMLEARGKSGISGHTHRMGSHYRTDCTGTKAWWENGCLCSLQPDYTFMPNWCQGFSIGHAIDGGQRFFIEQIPIIDSRILHGGMLWERRER